MLKPEWEDLCNELAKFHKEWTVPSRGRDAAAAVYKEDRQGLYDVCMGDPDVYEYWMWFFTEHLNRHRHPPGIRTNPLAPAKAPKQQTPTVLKLDFS